MYIYVYIRGAPPAPRRGLPAGARPLGRGRGGAPSNYLEYCIHYISILFRTNSIL